MDGTFFRTNFKINPYFRQKYPKVSSNFSTNNRRFFYICVENRLLDSSTVVKVLKKVEVFGPGFEFKGKLKQMFFLYCYAIENLTYIIQLVYYFYNKKFVLVYDRRYYFRVFKTNEVRDKVARYSLFTSVQIITFIHDSFI